jgi:hypothetical protein
MIYQGDGYGFTLLHFGDDNNTIRLDIMKYPLWEEIQQWFLTNTKQNFSSVDVPVWNIGTEMIFLAPIYFTLDDEDAMLFKLRWTV